MEKNYNYLARQYGMMGKEMLEKGDIQIAPERGYEYKICKEAYLDPDDKNYELYRDWVEYLRKRIPEVEFSLVTAPADKGMGSIEIHASVDGKTFILGSDYIGPSKFYSAKTLLEKSGKTLVQTQDYMVDMLNVTRRFSGHLVWPRGVIINGIRFPYGPRGANSINMSRGGSFGVFDRVDVSFYLLKKYFEIFIENDNEELKKKPFDMRAYYFMQNVEKTISKWKNGFRIFNIFTAFEVFTADNFNNAPRFSRRK